MLHSNKAAIDELLEKQSEGVRFFADFVKTSTVSGTPMVHKSFLKRPFEQVHSPSRRTEL